MDDQGLEFAMRKTAGYIVKIAAKEPRPKIGLKGMLTISALGVYGIKRIIDKIRNDHTRKAIIEQLMTEDPILKDADKGKLMEYYATIHMFAPHISRDKNVVRELLVNFVRFGRIDFPTLEALVRTEDKLKPGKTLAGFGMKIDPLDAGADLIEGAAAIFPGMTSVPGLGTLLG